MTDNVPINHAQSLLRLISIPEDELRADLQALNLPLVLMQSKAVPGNAISVEDYGRLFVHLVKKLQSKLSDGSSDRAVEFSAYRMLFEAMLHAGNLEQALQRASVYFQRLQPEAESFYLECDGDRVRCRFDFKAGEDRLLNAAENFSMEQLNWLPGMTGRLMSMSLWHRVCGWFIGCHIDLLEVELQQSANPRNQKLSDLFGAQVHFSATDNAFIFHRRYLDFPIVQGTAALETMLQTYPAELVKLDPRAASVSARVKNLVGSDFSRELPTLQQVADRLFMTTPTLHRRLRDEGNSFQKIKDDLRRDIAINHMMSKQYTTSQLAEMMGFSDSSTFHRAFKKWTGWTPQEYRQNQLSENGE
ncbi:MAG: helix-turn-helix domain-containing protein [Halieaceae bacterium]|jgi:AraC-like DNA-binding protein|nr:helix-turn-helix domain-containing protein [Halieaceae bacterium]